MASLNCKTYYYVKIVSDNMTFKVSASITFTNVSDMSLKFKQKLSQKQVDGLDFAQWI